MGGAERSRERRAYRESDARKDRAAQRAARPRRLVLQRIWGGPVLQYRHNEAFAMRHGVVVVVGVEEQYWRCDTAL